MSPDFGSVFLFFFGIAYLVGIAANALMAVVNLASWIKGITLISTDQIIIFLGLSNLCLQSTSVTAGFSYFFCPQIFSVGFSSQVFCFFLLYSTGSSYLLTGYLFGTYCLKMLNSDQWPIILWMKMKILKHTLWFILYIFVAIFSGSLIGSCHSPTEPNGNHTSNHTDNYSKPPLIFYRDERFRMAIFLTQGTWPLCFTCFHVMNLLNNIWKHLWQVKKTMTGSEEPNLDAFRDATKTLVSLLILHILYYLLWSVILLDYWSFSSIAFLIYMTVFSILTSGQAVAVIQGTPKLKKKALEIFKKFKLSKAERDGQKSCDI